MGGLQGQPLVLPGVRQRIAVQGLANCRKVQFRYGLAVSRPHFQIRFFQMRTQ